MNTAKVLNNLTSVFTSIGVTSRRWRSLGAILKTNPQGNKTILSLILNGYRSKKEISKTQASQLIFGLSDIEIFSCWIQ